MAFDMTFVTYRSPDPVNGEGQSHFPSHLKNDSCSVDFDLFSFLSSSFERQSEILVPSSLATAAAGDASGWCGTASAQTQRLFHFHH